MRRISVILATTILIFLLTACNSELETTGCRVIHQEDNYVTYQQVCENCGYEYGNPTTAHISKKTILHINLHTMRETDQRPHSAWIIR